MRAVVLALTLLAFSTAARAEVGEVRFVRQLGLGYLQIYLMEEMKLVEKHAAALGHPGLKASYRPVGSPTAMNDMLLSGGADMVAAGFPPFVTIWDKTRGTLNVKNIAALNCQPLLLNTNNPAVKSIRDFSDKDRIALPAVKVSTQATFLQMIAEKLYGVGQHERFDHLTVGLAHPEASAALIGGKSEITAHFASTPLQYQQLQNPQIRRVASSYDATDGPATTTNVWALSRFHDANPKTVRAILLALEEATAFIKAKPAEAAQIYIRLDNIRLAPDFVEKLIVDPEMVWELAPRNTVKIVAFMHRVGKIKNNPESWKDMFFAGVHSLEGS
jgi:NitT/TauT family transport system substrate-binding protein